MKKVLIFIILVLTGLVVFYFQNDKSLDLEVVQENKSEVIKTTNKVASATTKVPSKPNGQDKDIDELISDEELNEMNEYLEKIDSEWNNEIENLFMSDSKNGKVHVELYRELKRGYEDERERRYEAFHEEMRKKHGENYSYPPSSDEEMFNEKLVKAYEKVLSEKIGKEKMIEYMSLKDRFNAKLESELSDKTDFFTQIEF
jgi:hypothetical protein